MHVARSESFIVMIVISKLVHVVIATPTAALVCMYAYPLSQMRVHVCIYLCVRTNFSIR